MEASISSTTTNIVETKRKVQCPFCDKEYSGRRSLQSHVKSMHQGQTFLCHGCGWTTRFHNLLCRHKIRNHARKTATTITAPSTSSSALSAAAPSAAAPSAAATSYSIYYEDVEALKLFPLRLRTRKSCCFCSKTFVSSLEMQNHLAEVHRRRRFRCNDCDQVIRSHRLLSSHVCQNGGGSSGGGGGCSSQWC